jgi:hypothetical protein
VAAFLIVPHGGWWVEKTKPVWWRRGGAARDFAKRTQGGGWLTRRDRAREGKNVIRKNEANRAELGTFEAVIEILSNSDF